MSGHENALARGLIERLAADATVKALLGQPARIWDQAPEDPGFPYLLIGRSESRPVAADGCGIEHPDRYRVRVFDGETIRRVFEIEGGVAIYPEADLDVDFPAGIGPEARIGVSQAGGKWDWGVEAMIALNG